jgi:predicted nucleotide-binding protein
MYNLLITAMDDAWDQPNYVLDTTRFLEYTDPSLKERFKELDDRTIEVLTSAPSLFAYEKGIGKDARVGWIKRIQKRGGEIRITPSFDVSIPPIPEQTILDLAWDLEVGSYEENRTHWAVKKVDLLAVLNEHGLSGSIEPRKATGIRAPPYSASTSKHEQRLERTSDSGAVGRPKVFLVHGHDNAVKLDVARFLEKIGLEVIILHERPNRGRTLISKFQEESADVVYAVVLVTPDDVGRGNGSTQLSPRARQNVVFELGFFLGRLGSERVCAILAGAVEKPSDFEAVVYVSYGPKSDWRRELARELRASGLPLEEKKVLDGLL